MSPEPGAGPPASSSVFAELLRERRRARGMTQEEFAAKAGVGVRTLRDLEQGRARPQRATIDLLAAALELEGAERIEFALAARRGSGTDPIIEVRHGVNLPPAPPLIGRDTELEHLDAALRHAALVTLVGVAGVGKTSLAWTAAHRVAHRHPGGVAGIAISEVSTEADILATIGAVFEATRSRDLSARLSGRPALLLVDAVERSPDATLTALRWLQANVPTLRVIATGRHPTRVTGEYVWPVAPLETPAPGESELNEIVRYPAVQLFLDRLRDLGRTEVGPHDAKAVAELVRRLGGLPLALELAAARGRILAVPEILDRYGDRVLDLDGAIAGARAGAPTVGPGAAGSSAGARAGAPTVGPGAAGSSAGGESATLREAIAASYRLLEPNERWALRRLAQFRNRWSVELAEPLLADGPAAPNDIVVLLDRLTGLGLVNVRGSGAVRFRLLDMVRDFAREETEREGEVVAAAGRHVAVFTGYADRIAGELVGRTLPAAVARLNDVTSDLLAALAWAAEHDPVTGLRLAGTLARWWRFRGHDRQGRDWLRRLLDDPRTAGAEPTVRAWAQVAVAQLAAGHGAGLPDAEAALATFSRYGDVSGQLAARTQLCVLHQAAGDPEVARAHAAAVLALATRHGRTRDIVVAQNNLTWHEIRHGDLVAARRRLTAVQRLAGEVGEDRLRALAHANLAEVARLDGRYADAVAIGRRAIVQLEELGDPGHKRRVLNTIGLALAQAGRVAEAGAVLAELDHDGMAAMIEGYLARAAGDAGTATERFAAAAEALAGQYDLRDVVEALVGVAASTGDPARRKQVLTDLDALCARIHIVLLPTEAALLGR